MSNVIEIKSLTKDYGNGKGVFDVNISVEKGVVYGFLGPNGSGKTTTIRNLMGFIRPDKGQCNIFGMDCYKYAAEIQKSLGYLAGEISFLDDLNGTQMMEFMASMRGMKNKSRMNELIEFFELDARGKIKKMSKGMKQKIGIICAFMNDPQVILLDEPTSGLDPLMQNRFVDLILEEKSRGKTIFMSSHIFEEIEKTCDKAAIIKNGNIVSVEDMNSLIKKKKKFYNVTFKDVRELEKFLSEDVEIMEQKQNVVTAVVKGDINPFLKILSKYNIKDLDVKTQTLEEIFLHYYGGEK
ncbi:ABC-2 type transport system ATP-binding protein [Hathewaya proteolytica DSM 3090]|uniref:ABC-2 type transport system ATP-binding protein n=1 Tax=Hathewaya proteolytica DSM 3090 TaxID=1121331 RepID=A0A1M6NXT5_9CLOT|nr:ABC transporter ATP-binding protein [Hathewaya proteolytica]SHK00472.1 ABC-2 type transport system ATP-binding protein [Hathewaya proteolytica DSM 3090]